MDKKIIASPRYELKTIGLALKNKSSEQKAEIKAKELAKVVLPDKFTFSGFDIEIIKQPYIQVLNGKICLAIQIEASKNGDPLNVGDGIFEYYNPPILVHDGTYHKSLDSLGNEVSVRNLVEDPLQAFKEIIVETIRVLNK